MKVYVIAHGSYSDYSHVAMFTTRAAAEAAVATMVNKYGDESIEEWEVYEAVPPKRTLYTKECYAGQVRDHSNVYDGWAQPEHTYVGRFARGLGFGKWSNSQGDHYRYWGFDKKRVHKAFDDYHAQRQAERAGIA